MLGDRRSEELIDHREGAIIVTIGLLDVHTEGRLIDGRTDSEGDDLPADTQDTARELQFVEGREETQDDLLLLVLALVFATVLL